MKILRCPLNGPRNIAEFAYGGEVSDAPSDVDDEGWADHVWCRDNRAGIVREWWCHVPSSYWFIAERDTSRDEIVRTYPATALAEGRGVR
jgi:sarcosine oxidase subunit delta